MRQISKIASGKFLNEELIDVEIEHVLLDSRQVVFPGNSIFIALKGRRFDGHEFLEELYKKGLRNFMVSKILQAEKFPGSNFILVADTLKGLQCLAVNHRQQFDVPVIGITGSNGKTIVKEWLFQLLHEDFHIARSPKSYNSQTGVPLSILQLNEEHNLGIFEAGISQMGEMKKLEPIISSNIGVLTNIGEAHCEGFEDKEQKLKQKLKLFENSDIVIYCKDDKVVDETLKTWWAEKDRSTRLASWSSKNKNADLNISFAILKDGHTELNFQSANHSQLSKTKIPFTDHASIENAIHCLAVLLYLGLEPQTIMERMARLEPVAMRLELKEGNNNCIIINDSYNSDLTSLGIALDFLVQQSKSHRRTLILSDILQSGRPVNKLYSAVANLLLAKKVDRLIGIGQEISILKKILPPGFDHKFYHNTAEFLQKNTLPNFKEETILLKGARHFGFEKIANRLAMKVHQTVLEVNLSALLHNLRVYQSYLRTGTKLMVMVKASAYGSGSVEVAKLLEFQHVDYLAVAYADEGVELRKAGVQLPIMVLNPEPSTFDSLLRYQLEPEIYQFGLLEKYLHFLQAHSEKSMIHIKLDTGMHRLGFEKQDMGRLGQLLVSNKSFLNVKTIFSHLAASEADEHDLFTERQFNSFQKMYDKLSGILGHQPIRHILNSGGIIRFPNRQMEMARLGIGLYGIDGSQKIQEQLQTVLSLKATISQIKNIPEGHSIGYGRMVTAEIPKRIATLSIGYADGLLRKAGNGSYSVLIKGIKAPLVGNICMDMCMADISGIPDAKEGDEVIIFGIDEKGNKMPVQELANSLDTIPYEVFTSISGRVKRVYIQE